MPAPLHTSLIAHTYNPTMAQQPETMAANSLTMDLPCGIIQSTCREKRKAQECYCSEEDRDRRVSVPILFQDPNRRKTAADLNITNLPDDAVGLVAEYLSKTSRALLALALTTESSSWRDVQWNNKSASSSIALLWAKKKMKKPCASTNAIVSPSVTRDASNNLWEEIDFADVGSSLAKRLTDDDIAGVLACVNSIHKVKTLKLTGCVNITGRGLEPLRGSAVLQQLDLSLVGKFEDPKLIIPPLLLERDVIPILDSLIDRENHSLKQLQLPKNWRDRQSGSLDDFLQRYNQLESQASAECRCCQVRCHDILYIDNEHVNAEKRYGVQQFTCYSCLEHYCYYCCRCSCQRNNIIPMLVFCSGCEKRYCACCVAAFQCDECEQEGYDQQYFCSECQDNYKCDLCMRLICGENNCIERTKCTNCNQKVCYQCTTCNTKDQEKCSDCYDESEEDY